MPTTHYEWDPIDDVIIAEYDENHNLIAEYEHEPGYHGELISIRRDGHTSCVHDDGFGNVVALTDENGDVTDTYGYAAFGEVTERTGTTVNPFQYKGKHGYYRDEELGTYYVRAREYSPEMARWLSPDPLGFVDSLNLYLYVRNSPVMFVDPSGTQIAGMVPCAPADCTDCAQTAMKKTLMGGDKEVNHIMFLLEKYAKKEKSCEFDLRCCAPKSTDERCAECEVPFQEVRGLLNDPKMNAKYGGKSQIVLCTSAFTNFTGGAPKPYDKFARCQDVVETMRQELLHLLDRCSKFDEKKDKCANCVCDELRGHFYSGQCEPDSVWWILRGGRPKDKPFTSQIDCLTWSAAAACLKTCGAKSVEELVDKVKVIYPTCKPSPIYPDKPLPPLK